jgi:polyisoprenoid-binding protein YceI
MTLPNRALALAFALALFGPVAAAQAAPAKYVIDPEHLSISFTAMHMGWARVAGMFLEAGGSFVFDDEALALSEVRIEVVTKSVFSNHKRRDRHLRSPDFLNSREFPKMVFAGTSTERTGERAGILHGELTLIGEVRPLLLEIVWNKAGAYELGGPDRVGISARGRFLRSDFGMVYGVSNNLVGDEIEIVIEFEAIKQ